MVELAAAAVAGLVAGRLTWLAARPWFAQPTFQRPNYRNQLIPTAAGLVLPVALFVVEAGRAVAAAPDAPRLLTLLTVAGFCIVGTIDDVAGTGEDRGFRGHLLALAAGRVTTGLFKLLGGAAVALVAVSPIALADGGLGRLLADAALVALCANAANLLDRAPGRVGKVSVAGFVVLVLATGGDPALAGVAALVGAGAALLLDDLRERLMLGDAGSNPLGAAIGLGLVLTVGPGIRNAALVAVLALNLLGELVSFSRVIEAVPPLRALDRIGRTR